MASPTKSEIEIPSIGRDVSAEIPSLSRFNYAFESFPIEIQPKTYMVSLHASGESRVIPRSELVLVWDYARRAFLPEFDEVLRIHMPAKAELREQIIRRLLSGGRPSDVVYKAYEAGSTFSYITKSLISRPDICDYYQLSYVDVDITTRQIGSNQDKEEIRDTGVTLKKEGDKYSIDLKIGMNYPLENAKLLINWYKSIF